MRIAFFVRMLLMVVFLVLFTITGRGQSIITEKVSLGLKDESLQAAITKIEQQSVFRFFYRDEDITSINHLNLATATRTIEQTLQLVLQNLPLVLPADRS